MIAVTEPGDPVVRLGSTEADLRTALPRYRVWEDGKPVREPTNVLDLWDEDAVGFLLGCSHTFEGAPEQAGVHFPRSQHSQAPSGYVTNISTIGVGPMSGPLVVSMRLVPARQVPRTIEVTSRYPSGHGAPVHVRDPGEIGIADILRPDFGPTPEPQPGDVPVFWACGVTPQLFLQGIGAEYVIAHLPGHMFVFDHHVDEDPTSPRIATRA